MIVSITARIQRGVTDDPEQSERDRQGKPVPASRAGTSGEAGQPRRSTTATSFLRLTLRPAESPFRAPCKRP